MKLLFENWRKILEGEVVSGPWGEEPPGEEAEVQSLSRRNAELANAAETLVLRMMMDAYGESSNWSEEQLTAIDQFNGALDILFPSE